MFDAQFCEASNTLGCFAVESTSWIFVCLVIFCGFDPMGYITIFQPPFWGMYIYNIYIYLEPKMTLVFIGKWHCFGGIDLQKERSLRLQVYIDRSKHRRVANLRHWIQSGQIIATSHDLTPNGGLVRQIPFFQGNLG